MNTLLLFLIIIVCLIAFAVICSIIDNRRLVVRNYIIDSKKIDRDIKVVFLSDMHDNQIGRDNNRLIDAVKDANPDLILIGGDMITAHPGCKWDKATNLLKGLKSIDVPIVYGMGNHEYRMDIYRDEYGDAYDLMTKEFAGAGATIVQNDKISFDEMNIDIQGLMIDRKYYKRWRGRTTPDRRTIGLYTGEYDRNRLRIMLAHNPEYFDAYSPYADIVLSGHVHGGIMVLPVLGGVMSPRLTFFPKYDGGRFDITREDGSASTMVISRGLGSHTIPIRIFNPLEMVIIDIHSTKS